LVNTRPNGHSRVATLLRYARILVVEAVQASALTGGRLMRYSSAICLGAVGMKAVLTFICPALPARKGNA
jgi:hypothetical protein